MHIEVVPSLDTSSCVMGVRRFVARRGTPTTIMSDNGTNFVGAQKERLACVESWNKLTPAIFCPERDQMEIQSAQRTAPWWLLGAISSECQACFV